MIPVVFAHRRSAESSDAQTKHRINVVAIAVLLASLAIGVLGTVAIDNPVPLIAMLVVGLVLMQ